MRLVHHFGEDWESQQLFQCIDINFHGALRMKYHALMMTWMTFSLAPPFFYSLWFVLFFSGGFPWYLVHTPNISREWIQKTLMIISPLLLRHLLVSGFTYTAKNIGKNFMDWHRIWYRHSLFHESANEDNPLTFPCCFHKEITQQILDRICLGTYKYKLNTVIIL